MPGREREQVRSFVGRVVVDVQVRIFRPSLLDVGEKFDESGAFLGERVCPERHERLVRLNEPEEVVDPPLVDGRGCPRGLPRLEVERVALEVEEDVALVGRGQHGERRRIVELDLGYLPDGLRPHLQLGLRAQNGDGRVGDA